MTSPSRPDAVVDVEARDLHRLHSLRCEPLLGVENELHNKRCHQRPFISGALATQAPAAAIIACDGLSLTGSRFESGDKPSE